MQLASSPTPTPAHHPHVESESEFEASGGHTDARVGGWRETRGARSPIVMPALAKTLLAAGTCTAVAGAHADASRFLLPSRLPKAHTRNRAPVLADSLAFPPSLRRSAFPHDHVVNAAAAVGAAGSLGVLAGVYRVRLNRCRCSKAERAEVKQGGAFAMHCRRCLKRTNKGVFVSFLTSPLYVAGAAVGVAHCAHALGTPMVKGAGRVRASRR